MAGHNTIMARLVAPTGAVVRPMPRLSISAMPNVTGFIPAARTTGGSTGVAIMMRGATSMTVPSRSSST